MEVDASIPLRAGQDVTPPVNMLQSYGQALQLANARQQLLQSQSQAAAGQAFQGAIGPDGSVNPLTLNQNLAANPMAARSAVATSQAGQSNVQTALANMGMTQEQGFQRATYVGNAIGSLLATGKPVQMKDVQDVVSTVVANHGMTAKEGAQLIAQAASIPPDQLTGMAKQYYAMAQKGAAMLAPQPSAIDNGPNINLVNTNSMASVPVGQQMGVIPKALSPGESAQQVPTILPSGAQGATSLAQQLQAERMSPTGGVATGLAPGVGESATVRAQSSAQMGQKIVADASSVPQQRSAIQQGLAELDSANPGPLQDRLAKFGGTLAQFGIPSEQATAAQLMHKSNMLGVLSQVSSGMGVATDDKMNAVVGANPNGTMTNEAFKAASGIVLGNLDYLQAKANAWQKYSSNNAALKDPELANHFQDEWNKTVPNATAFQFNHLPAAEQAKYWNSIDKQQKQQLLQTMQTFGMQVTKNGK